MPSQVSAAMASSPAPTRFQPASVAVAQTGVVPLSPGLHPQNATTTGPFGGWAGWNPHGQGNVPNIIGGSSSVGSGGSLGIGSFAGMNSHGNSGQQGQGQATSRGNPFGSAQSGTLGP